MKNNIHIVRFSLLLVAFLSSFVGFSQTNFQRSVVKITNFNSPAIDVPIPTDCHDARIGVRLFYGGQQAHNLTTYQNNWVSAVNFSLLFTAPSPVLPACTAISVSESNSITLRLEETWANNQPIKQTYIHGEIFNLAYKKKDFVADANGCIKYDKVRLAMSVNNQTPNAPADIYAEIEIYTTSLTALSSNTQFNFGKKELNNQAKALLFWDYVEGAVSYELEWTYLDGYTSIPALNKEAKDLTDAEINSLALDFAFREKEPVRVVTNNQHFELPLTYPSGLLFYRVRPIGFYEVSTDILQVNSSQERKIGKWQYGNIADGKRLFTRLSEDFEGDKLWQVVTTFAEEGKFKKVMSYLDGSSRNRQTVTHSNSDETTLVAEQFYNYEGAANVQILPSPLLSSGLHYRADVNFFADPTGKATRNKEAYDGSIARMHQDFGAARYYSGNNPFLSTATKNKLHNWYSQYVPESAGFVASQSQMLNDNTNRVKVQGGVGETFRVGGGHDTKYFYGTAAGNELNRLFGIQVGDAKHYRKTLVEDANGQVSLSYTNQEGKTIATALAQANPENLQKLNWNYPAGINVNVNLKDYTQKVDDGSRWLTQFNLLNADASTDYTLSYQVNLTNTCAECAYTTKIKIIDQNTSKVIDINGQLAEKTVDFGAGLCAVTAPTWTFKLPVGSYTIYKEVFVKGKTWDELKADILNPNSTSTLHNDYTSQLGALTAAHNALLGLNVDCATDYNNISYYMESAIKDQVLTGCQFGTGAPIPPTDPRYCEYVACMELAEAQVFAKKLYLINTWSEAKAIFGLNLNKTFYQQDPLFQHLKYGKPYWGNIERLLGALSVNAGKAPVNIENAVTQAYTADNKRWELFRQLYLQARQIVYLKSIAETKITENDYLGCPNVTTNLATDFETQYGAWRQSNAQVFFENNPSNTAQKLFEFITSQCPSVQSSNLQNLLTTFYTNLDVQKNPWRLLYTDATDANLVAIKAILQNSCAANLLPILMPNLSDYQVLPQFYELLQPAKTVLQRNNTPLSTTTVAAIQAAPFARQDVLLAARDENQNSIEFILDHVKLNNKLLANGTLEYQETVPLLSRKLVGTYPLSIGGTVQNIPTYFILGIKQVIPTKSELVTIPTGGTTTVSYPGKAQYQLFAEGFWMSPEFWANAAGQITNSVIQQLSVLPITYSLPNGLQPCDHIRVSFEKDAQGNYISFSIFVNGNLIGTNLLTDIIPALTSPPPPPPTGGKCYDQSGNEIPCPCGNNATTGAPNPCPCILDEPFYDQNGNLVACYDLNPKDPLPAEPCYSGKGKPIPCPCGNDPVRGTPIPCPCLSGTPPFYDQNGNLVPCDGGIVIDTGIEEGIQGNADSTQTKSKIANSKEETLSTATPNAQSLAYTFTENWAWGGSWTSKPNPTAADLNTFRGAVHSIVLKTDNTVLQRYEVINQNIAGLNNATALTLPANTSEYNWLPSQCIAAPQMALPYLKEVAQRINIASLIVACSTKRRAILVQQFEDDKIGLLNSILVKARIPNSKCIDKINESIETSTLTYTPKEYHYTLYYYDQAQNLTATVPPRGVVPDGTGLNHSLMTHYSFNTLNQPSLQQSPDGGKTKFWYDKVTRLRVSQNAKQSKESTVSSKFIASYTSYDEIGRTIETGQLRYTPTSNNNITWQTYLAQNIDKPEFPVPLTTILVKEQLTHTNYDEGQAEFSVGLPRYGRNRITATYTQKTYNANPADIYKDTKTVYWYDVHGNVKHLVQYLGDNTRTKHVDYDYDLISGKVNKVYFQKGSNDQFIHRYTYDADNRLTNVETSVDNWFFAQEAAYFYYPHGPLARIELGHHKIQGIDYAYTLQGWLKGVNSLHDGTTEHLPINDMGADGHNTNQIHHKRVGKDVFAFALHYFKEDYKPVVGNTSIYNETANTAMYANQTVKSLYNGNIAAMRTAIHTPNATNPSLKSANPVQQIMAYQYDQLNRIMTTRHLDLANAYQTTAKYNENYSYDPNGNILTLDRTNGQAQSFDQLVYKYDQMNPTTLRNNQLKQVQDALGNTNAASNDIENQTDANNYVYDEIGNLIIDKSENIANIVWSIYGKVLKVEKQTVLKTTVIEYLYDATGNRVKKNVKINNTGTSTITKNITSFYYRDAQGNVLNTVSTGTERDLNNNDQVINTTEFSIYGSSRLGAYKPNVTPMSALDGIGNGRLTLGFKTYELSNHLGNVLTTISDNVIIEATLTKQARVLSSQDYYPFGMAMTERSYQESQETKYRYGFNGKEEDFDMSEGMHNFEARELDVRICRFTSTDPLAAKYPNESTYVFVGNSPLLFIDINGKEKIVISGGGDVHNNHKMNFIEASKIQLKSYVADVKKVKSSQKVSWIIFDYDYTEKEKQQFVKWAKKNGVEPPIYVKNNEDIVNYVNSKDVNNASLTTQRTEDKISNIGVFAHGVPGFISFGFENKDEPTENTPGSLASTDFAGSTAKLLNPKAFFTWANIDLYSCNAATPQDDEAKNFTTKAEVIAASKNKENVASELSKTGATVSGYIGRTYYRGGGKLPRAGNTSGQYSPTIDGKNMRAFKMTFKNGKYVKNE